MTENAQIQAPMIATIIPTVGRHSLARAVESARAQGLPPGTHEVIVVNDTGRPLSPAAWQADGRVRVVTTSRRERCVARNTGAALSRATWLHFLDDDDWLLPGGLAALAEAAQQTGADWVFGGTQLVDRQLRPQLILQPEMPAFPFVQAMAGEWTPLQASLIRAEAFWAVGGFRPRVLATQDVALARDMALRGRFAGISDVVCVVQIGPEGSTTRQHGRRAYSLGARESILDQNGARARLQASANTPAWRGRVLRFYLTSAVWNWGQGRRLRALERLATAGGILLQHWPDWPRPAYWHHVLRAYQSRAFAPPAATPPAVSHINGHRRGQRLLAIQPPGVAGPADHIDA